MRLQYQMTNATVSDSGVSLRRISRRNFAAARPQSLTRDRAWPFAAAPPRASTISNVCEKRCPRTCAGDRGSASAHARLITNGVW
jgi:hypothetical protein